MANSAYTFLDFSGEKSTFSVSNGAITSVSLPGFLTQFGALRDAVDAITLGTLHKEMWVGDNTVLSNVRPTSVFAQREMKWLVRYQGNTSQKIFTAEIPTADPTGRLLAGSDRADLTSGSGMPAFVTAFQNLVRSPDDPSETVTILDIYLVGRNI